jgi:hypothetical protein
VVRWNGFSDSYDDLAATAAAGRPPTSQVKGFGRRALLTAPAGGRPATSHVVVCALGVGGGGCTWDTLGIITV